MSLPITDKTLTKLSPKDTVEKVFEDMGGVPNMVSWAKANPSTFYTQLYGKLVSQPIDLNLSGGIRIDLPWLASRPGRPPVVLDALREESPSEPAPVQLPAAAAVHPSPQPDAKVRVRRLSPAKRKNSGAGK